MSAIDLLIGTDTAEVRALAAALGARTELVPPGPGTAGSRVADLASWRDEIAGGPPAITIAVAMWPDVREPSALVDLDDEAWHQRAEAPIVEWTAALGGAATRCIDGGRIVAVIERPPPLDTAGWAAEAGVADGVEALVRSLARSEGWRRVRVNAVTTPFRLVDGPVIPPAPSLSSFPGGIDPEVADAVAMLAGAGVSGVTGTIVNADCGRAWR